MNDILKMISENIAYIVIGIGVIVFIQLLIIIKLLMNNRRLNKQYKKMFKSDANSIVELVENYMKIIEEVKEESNRTQKMCMEVSNKMGTSIRKVDIMRYRAFEDVGSDLSFSLAMLDDRNNGAILTSIFGRTESTMYAKPIESGISRYELSSEEKKVLESAINL